MKEGLFMKYLRLTGFLLIAAIILTCFSFTVSASSEVVKNDSTGIPDIEFYNAVREELNLEDGEDLLKSDIESIQYYLTLDNKNIKSLKGIELFTNVVCLSADNNKITSLEGIEFPAKCTDVSLRNNYLTSLDAEGLHFSSLDLTNNKISGVKNLQCGLAALGENNLKTIKNLENVKVEALDLSLNSFTDFDEIAEYFKENDNIDYLSVSFNPFDQDISYINNIRKKFDEAYQGRHLAMAGMCTDKDDASSYKLSNYKGPYYKDVYEIDYKECQDIEDLNFLTAGKHTFTFATERNNSEPFVPYSMFEHTVNLNSKQTAPPNNIIADNDNILNVEYATDEITINIENTDELNLEFKVPSERILFADKEKTVPIENPISISENYIYIYTNIYNREYRIKIQKPPVYENFQDEIPSWAENAVTNLTQSGVIKGFNHLFNGGDFATREEALAFIIRYMGLEKTCYQTFTDPPYDDINMISDWAKDYAKAGYHKDIMRGSLDNGQLLFRNKDNITREEFFVMLKRIIGADENADNYTLTFTDSKDISSYALDSIKYLTKNGFIKGYDDDTIRPKDYITRNEIAVFLDRLFDLN